MEAAIPVNRRLAAACPALVSTRSLPQQETRKDCGLQNNPTSLETVCQTTLTSLQLTNRPVYMSPKISA